MYVNCQHVTCTELNRAVHMLKCMNVVEYLGEFSLSDYTETITISTVSICATFPYQKNVNLN